MGIEKGMSGTVWANYAQMLILGGYSVFANLEEFLGPTDVVMVAYIFLMGGLGIMYNLKLVTITKRFPFLGTNAGKIMYFFLAATMGLSFGFSGDYTYLVPFLSGCASLCVSIYIMICVCLGYRDRANQAAAAEQGGGAPATSAVGSTAAAPAATGPAAI